METLDHPVRYRDVLSRHGAGIDRFARAAIGRGSAATALSDTRILRGLSPEVLVTEAASRVDPLLDVDMSDIVLSGWRHHDDLVDAARRTSTSDEDDDIEEVVKLDTHGLTWESDPSIEVTIDGEVIHTVRVHLVAQADVHDATALVRDGRLVGIRSGDVDVRAHVEVEGHRVADGVRRFNLASSVDLRDGFDLTDRG